MHGLCGRYSVCAAPGETGALGDVTVRRVGGELDVYWLENGLLRLGLVPALGGRLLAVRFGGAELLWRNEALLSNELRPVGGHHPSPVAGAMGAWVNYGGDKTWPAPQGWDGDGQWPGPPDPVLDSGPYRAEPWAEGSAAGVTMTSADDPHTGLRLRRRFTLYTDRAAYRLDITALNSSASPVRWAIWNVTQFPAADPTGGVRLGTGPEVLALVSGTGVPSYGFDDARQAVHVPHQDVVGKLGFPAAAGWLTHTGSGAALTQRFQVIDGAPYPDGGSRVEVWLEHPVPKAGSARRKPASCAAR